MSYVNDPSELAMPPVLEYDPDEVEEPPGPQEIFHQQIPYMGSTVSPYRGIHVDLCRFDEEGNHTQMAKNCPHFETEDELGKRIRPGWTVQSG